MKRVLLAVLLALFVSGAGYSSLTSNDDGIWLMTSQHPEDLALLDPFISSKKENGRALTVTLNTPESKLPEKVRKLLRPIPPSEIRQYEYQSRRETKADPKIQKLLLEVSPASLKETVVKLASVEDRSASALGNREIVDWAKSKFEILGYATTLQCFRPRECNVIAEKRGTSEPEKVVVVIAHMDSVGEPFAGADDNASGSAGALEIARVLSGKNSSKTIRFILANSEEEGMVGSYEYVEALGTSVSNIELVIAMDMIGYNSNGVLDVETNREFEGLARWFAEKVRAYTRLTPRIAIPAWGSDHVPFLEKGVPSLLPLEHWQTKTPCYHQGCDKPDTLNYEYAADITRVNTAVVVEKAGIEL